jgi:EAL and modified HD-GYP domain-containing signal transduction protein
MSSDCATASTLRDSMLALGLDVLTSGRPAFLNVTRTMLLGDFGALLPPGGMVLELREDVAVDEEVVVACQRLLQQGFTVAVGNFVPGSEAEALLLYVQLVKVDVQATSPEERVATARRVSTRVRLVAEKVETTEEFDATRAEGYSFFQGHFFWRGRAARCPPVV